MVRLPPRTTGTDSLLPDTTLFRSSVTCGRVRPERVMAAGLVLIAAGTFLAAAADTFTVFTVGRVIAALGGAALVPSAIGARSEEHTSELQSLMRISYAVFCLKKKSIDT